MNGAILYFHRDRHISLLTFLTVNHFITLNINKK
jgi:hypothetical protein